MAKHSRYTGRKKTILICIYTSHMHKITLVNISFEGIICNNCQNVGATSGDFIQLTCMCKDELDIGHINCAEVCEANANKGSRKKRDSVSTFLGKQIEYGMQVFHVECMKVQEKLLERFATYVIVILSGI
ncbi:hypothetical protein QL285_033027 [Trifolium repens]|nr:hypothetical protein QL285_033027 [Trifolium repens]